MRSLFTLAVLLIAVPAWAQARSDPWADEKEAIVALHKSRQNALRAEVGKHISVRGHVRDFLLFVNSKSQALDVSRIEDARTDKQVGAPGNTAGSPSAVSKGAVPSILGFAVENGALSQQSSDTTITFRGTAVGWLDLIQNQGFIAAYQDDSAFVRQLRRVSYSFTLNTDTTPDEAAVRAAGAVSLDAIREELRRTRQQLAGYSLRVAVVDQRDPRAAANRAAIAQLLDTAGIDLLKATDFLDPVFNSPEYTAWQQQSEEVLSQDGLTAAQIGRLVDQRLEEMRQMMMRQIPDFNEQVTDLLLAYQGFDKARLGVFEAIKKRPLLAVEYVNARSPELPDKDTLRFIVEGQLGPRLDLTGNVAWTFQREGVVELPEPHAIESTRDFEAAAQLDIPLGNAAKQLGGVTGIGVPVFAVAYLSQKLSENAAVSFAGHTFTVEPGWIHMLQARLTVPVKGSGVKIPLSLSFANRTELLREKTVRGHIGLTFDMDVLSALRP